MLVKYDPGLFTHVYSFSFRGGAALEARTPRIPPADKLLEPREDWKPRLSSQPGANVLSLNNRNI